MENATLKAFSIKIITLKYSDVWHLNSYIIDVIFVSEKKISQNIFLFNERWTFLFDECDNGYLQFDHVYKQ